MASSKIKLAAETLFENVKWDRTAMSIKEAFDEIEARLARLEGSREEGELEMLRRENATLKAQLANARQLLDGALEAGKKARAHDLAVVVAFLRDRAEQYDDSSCCRCVFDELLEALRKDERTEAYRHGELDDLMARPLR